MSFSASAWALRCPVSGPTKAVLLVLAIHANQDEVCWPSVETIAREAGVSERSVQDGIRDLEKGGLVASEGQGGRRLTKRYTLQVDVELADPLPKRVRVARERVHVAQERVRESAQKGAPPAPEPIREPSREPPVNHARQTAMILPITGGRAPKATESQLPDWLPLEAWEGFVESRKKMRVPFTDRARMLILRDLADFHRRGIDVEAALNTAVALGWRGVFEPRGATPAARPRLTAAQAARASHFAPPAWHDEAPVIDGALTREYG